MPDVQDMRIVYVISQPITVTGRVLLYRTWGLPRYCTEAKRCDDDLQPQHFIDEKHTKNQI